MPRRSTPLALFCHTSAFEEKSNNPHKQGNRKEILNTTKGIHRYEAKVVPKSYEAYVRQSNVITKIVSNKRCPTSHSLTLHCQRPYHRLQRFLVEYPPKGELHQLSLDGQRGLRQ
jgi:hypothetical protein